MSVDIQVTQWTFTGMGEVEATLISMHLADAEKLLFTIFFFFVLLGCLFSYPPVSRDKSLFVCLFVLFLFLFLI